MMIRCPSVREIDLGNFTFCVQKLTSDSSTTPFPTEKKRPNRRPLVDENMAFYTVCAYDSESQQTSIGHTTCATRYFGSISWSIAVGGKRTP